MLLDADAIVSSADTELIFTTVSVRILSATSRNGHAPQPLSSPTKRGVPGGGVIPYLAFLSSNLLVLWAGWTTSWTLFIAVGGGCPASCA